MRPSPRQALYVYSNVGAAVLLSTSIEDIDFSELASPIVAGVAPALAASVPGLGGISRLLVNSLANGAANAFLTLRVGMLTKQYCAALVRPEPVAVRRTASLAALALLGNVTRDGGARVSKAILQAAGSSLGGAANAAAQGARNVGARAGQAARAAADAVSNVTDQVVGAAGSMVSATARAGQRLVGRAEPAIDLPASAGENAALPPDRVARRRP